MTLGAAAFVAVVAAALFLVRAQGKVPDPRPSDETAALVQTWRRASTPTAHVTSCRAAGERDAVTAGASIWVCRLWYVRPSRFAILCVAVAEHVVRRQIGAEDPAAPHGARCEGRSDEPEPVLDGSY
jgi:hypothetical protein